MSEQERERFADAMEEAARLFEFGHAALRRAKTLCNGDLAERVDVMFKRAYEMKVKADWLRYSGLGKIDLPAQQRGAADRRVGVDRRIGKMLKELSSVAS